MILVKMHNFLTKHKLIRSVKTMYHEYPNYRPELLKYLTPFFQETLMKAGTDAIYDATGKQYTYGPIFSAICEHFLFCFFFFCFLITKLITIYRTDASIALTGFYAARLSGRI